MPEIPPRTLTADLYSYHGALYLLGPTGDLFLDNHMDAERVHVALQCVCTYVYFTYVYMCVSVYTHTWAFKGLLCPFFWGQRMYHTSYHHLTAGPHKGIHDRCKLPQQ